MILLNPKRYQSQIGKTVNDPKTKALMEKTVTFFEEKGLAKIKADDQTGIWYQDFLDFQKSEKIFATFLTPSGYGAGDSRWDTARIEEYSEILGFYGLCYWYTWQVSILGLGPIWMSPNEELKKKAAKALDDGGIFAFGLSEKEHGADLYSSSMRLTPSPDGKFVANGSKYYIGNGNKAAMVSIFAKNSEKDEYVWFTVDPKDSHYSHYKIETSGVRQSYVAGIDIKDYPVVKEQILSEGSDAWDAALNTVNIGKFQLGWASIGICTHALYEALRHAGSRVLYKKHVTDFPHVQVLFTEAYTRLVAMKLYALRAGDYFRVASEEDRRYLLFNPIQKMKVTMEGESVVEQLHQIIAAKGFEQKTYFEMAIRDIRMLPKLEGTVHVNVALVTKFMKNYFFAPKDFAPVAKQDQMIHDDFHFHQGPTKGLSQVVFANYRDAFAALNTPNISLFKEQIESFKEFLLKATPTEAQSKNMDYMLQLGELFTMIPYAQLIAENKEIYKIDDQLLDEIFKNFVGDFSKFAIRFYTGQDNDENQQKFIMAMIRKPHLDEAQFRNLWEKQVLPLKDVY